MSQVPDGWTASALRDVTSKPSKVDPVSTGRQSVRYVDIGLLDGPVDNLTSAPEVVADAAPSRCRQVVAEGDTLYSTVRPYLRKIAYVCAPLDQEFASTGYSVLRASSAIDTKYLYYFCLSPQFENQIMPLQKGVSYPAVLDRDIRAQSIWYPEVDSQRRIVGILEDHLSRLDAASDYASVAERRLSRLRDQLVHDAITGATSELPRDASSLAPAGTADGDLPALPTDWNWRRLGEIADVAGGVTKDAKKQSDPSFVEVPYLRVANVQRGSLRLNDVSSIRVSPAKADALRLTLGDVLLNEGGDRDKLARGWVWEGQIEDCIHQNHVFRARPHIEIDPYFLSWCANTIGGRWAERNGKQSVNLASISLSMIRKMPVIVPPLETAQLVVAQLHDRLRDLDKTAASIAATQARTSALHRALLAAAFSGKLTGRHTDDEVIEEVAG